MKLLIDSNRYSDMIRGDKDVASRFASATELWMPLIFLPMIFFACCFVAWRNVSLWYEQGEEFEDALVEAQHTHNIVPPNIYEPRAR